MRSSTAGSQPRRPRWPTSSSRREASAAADDPLTTSGPFTTGVVFRVVEPLRVVQWSTGNVGRQALAAVLDHPELALVGLFAFDPAKVGTDAGVLCGRAPVGVT